MRLVREAVGPEVDLCVEVHRRLTPPEAKNGNLLGDEMVLGLSQHQSGFIAIPSAPGIGVTLAEDAEKRFPYKPKPVQMRAHVDGSFVDQ